MKLFLAIFALLSSALLAAEPRVLFLGDSITYDGRWTTLVESALRHTADYRSAEIFNLGLPSETVSGLSEPNHAGGKFPRPDLHERLSRVLPALKPTLVIACYGMNDGIYLPPDPEREAAYQKGIMDLKAEVEKTGAKIVFLTPPLHQADQPSDRPERYDVVLDHFATWLNSKRSEGWMVGDIRPSLRLAIREEKQKNPAFVYANDSVHPGDLGHEFIARAVTNSIWPLLKLPGQPRFDQGEALNLIRERQNLLKLAWLSETRHIRPGIPKGLPIDAANTRATSLLEQYLKLTPP